MKEDLRVVLTDFYNTEVPPIAQRKKDEILQTGKTYYNKMTELERDFRWEPIDAEDIQRVLRFWVARFVKEKPDLTLEKAVGMIKKTKQVYEDYYTDASRHISLERVSTTSFKSMQEALHLCSHAWQFLHLSLSITGTKIAKRDSIPRVVPTGQTLLHQPWRPKKNASVPTSKSVTPATSASGQTGSTTLRTMRP